MLPLKDGPYAYQQILAALPAAASSSASAAATGWSLLSLAEANWAQLGSEDLKVRSQLGFELVNERQHKHRPAICCKHKHSDLQRKTRMTTRQTARSRRWTPGRPVRPGEEGLRNSSGDAFPAAVVTDRPTSQRCPPLRPVVPPPPGSVSAAARQRKVTARAKGNYLVSKWVIAFARLGSLSPSLRSRLSNNPGPPPRRRSLRVHSAQVWARRPPPLGSRRGLGQG
jgi:hypothetical protein